MGVFKLVWHGRGMRIPTDPDKRDRCVRPGTGYISNHCGARNAAKPPFRFDAPPRVSPVSCACPPYVRAIYAS